MVMLVLNPHFAFANVKDEAQIKTIVESVGTLADTNNYESLEKLYAPEIQVDYRSLSGGDIELKSPRALMTQWASVLPGFDVTRHEISDIKVSANGVTATATASVVADHYVGSLFWQVRGKYTYRFVKDAAIWLITAHKFELLEESGTRDVFAVAVENAKQNPPNYLIRHNSQKTVSKFVEAIEDQHPASIAGLLSDDGAIFESTHLATINKKIGKTKITIDYMRNARNVGKNRMIYTMKDPNLILIETRSKLEESHLEKKAANCFVALIHLENDKVKMIREYS
ncbi:nuclear transport factor 2 family protein [Aliiglaciecola sp. M165]|uniref:nuclear transport factor 2 family protein n=1 Tax=Aliiglaciecola sp. M165 TaxID=2593649 RepID=UPI00163DD011|nr:nuclear transport factor 2 family protein [Aliiglaciecola sp. M165]